MKVEANQNDSRFRKLPNYKNGAAVISDGRRKKGFVCAGVRANLLRGYCALRTPWGLILYLE
jgi:hypothetical protein